MIARMGATTTYGWRIPDLADAANAPDAFQKAMQDAENTFKDATMQSYVPAWTSEGAVQPSGAFTRTAYYRVDNGVCHLFISITIDGTTNGGTGSLVLAAPLAPNTTIRRQIMPCYFVANASGGGVYNGFGNLTNTDGTKIRIYFPGSSTDTRMAQWRNAQDGNAAGSGIPVVPSGWGIMPGSEFVLSGHYIL